jgi:hypothetical protein
MVTVLLALHIVHSVAAATPARTIEFEELWRTDPYSDEYLMGNVMSATVYDDGNFYFMDAQLQEVFKFDAQGNYVTTVARKGEGPGELDQVWTVYWWPPDAIVLPRMFPPKIIRVSPDGVPLDELHVYRQESDDTKASVTDITPVGDHAVVDGSMSQFSPDGNRRISWLGVIDRTGTVVHEFAHKEQELPANPLEQVVDEAANFWEWGRWAASPDGHVFRAPDREKWLIERYDLEGNLTGTYERDITARKRTEEEFDEMKEGYSFIFNGQEVIPTFKLLDTVPPIHSLVIVGDRLWVMHDPVPDALPEDVWRRASVLSFDGEHIEDVDIRIPRDEEQDSVRLLRDGRLMVVENGIAAMQAHFANFGGGGSDDEDEDLSDAEPAEIVIYGPKR